MMRTTSQPDGSAPFGPDVRSRTIRNLKFIGWALHMFAASHGGRLPTAAIRDRGNALLSWRVAILPFLEEQALYERFRLDEAWNSPHNLSLLHEMPGVYVPAAHEGTMPYTTCYQGIGGPGSLFGGEEGAMIAEVTSVASPKLMVVEAAEPVPWTRPEDVPYDEAGPLPALGGHSSEGVYVALADGSVRFLSRQTPPATLRALIRRGDAGIISPEEIGPWQHEGPC